MSEGEAGRARSVRLEGLGKAYGDVRAVEPTDLEVRRGELLVLLGPSGCGKTTVLRMIAGLEEPTEGHVHIGDDRVDDRDPSERDVAMVFQSYALYPHMSVRANLAFGLKVRKTDRGEIERRVASAAAILGLEGLLDRRPGQLSGGQKQRVALGRAMVREPAVFLFDEPLSNLDARLRLEMRSEIADLHDRLDATMVYVTHDQVEAMTLGDRIAVMRAGRLQQCAPPLEVYREPANLFVARFVGTPSINTVSGELVAGGDGTVFRADGLRVETPDLASREDPVVLGVRPEDLELVEAEAVGPAPPATAAADGEGGGTSDARGGGPADEGDRGGTAPVGGRDAQFHGRSAHFRSRVGRLEPLGSEVLVHLEGAIGDGWVARVPPDRAVEEGSEVAVRLAAGRFHLFDAETGSRLERSAPCPRGTS